MPTPGNLNSTQSDSLHGTRGIVAVIDDDPQMRETLAEVVRQMFYDVHVYCDAESALAECHFASATLVVTDLGMPGMSGVEMAGRIHRRFPALAILLVTGWGNRLDRANLSMSGVRAVLEKPFTIDQVRGAIADCLASTTSQK